MKDFSLVNSITNNIVNILQSYDDWVPQLVSSLPGLMNTVLNVVTNVLFSIIIAIYMLFDFERIKRGLRKFVHLFFKNSDIYLHEIDQNVTVYLKSLIILMLIKFIEYSAFYFMIDPVALKDIEENRASQLAKSSSEAIVSTMKGCVQMFSDVFDGLLH